MAKNFPQKFHEKIPGFATKQLSPRRWVPVESEAAKKVCDICRSPNCDGMERTIMKFCGDNKFSQNKEKKYMLKWRKQHPNNCEVSNPKKSPKKSAAEKEIVVLMNIKLQLAREKSNRGGLLKSLGYL